MLSFCAVLLLCVVMKWSVLYALVAGVAIFCLYGRKQGFGWKQLGSMLLSGAATAKNVVTVIGMMGVVAGLWRACGTIPFIICAASGFIGPNTVILMTFLMNAMVSMLMGSAFGVSATMGAISITMAMAMGVNPVLAGGAMLSGVFVGDRASPVSSSALLVSEVTHTDLFDNLKKMMRSSAVPFLLCCVIYGAMGLSAGQAGQTADLWDVFGREMRLHWSALIPAAVVLLLSSLRVPTKKTVLASIGAAALVCVLVQKMSVGRVLELAVLGFHAADPEVAGMLDGGGLISMVKSMAIVGLSSSYSGIFRNTKLLAGMKTGLQRLAEKVTPFGSMIVTSLVTGGIACNQTLCVLMTHQLCEDMEPDGKELAMALENSAILLCGLIPWSIAGGVPLASAGAPITGMLAAFYLYLVPLYTFVRKLAARRAAAGGAEARRPAPAQR